MIVRSALAALLLLAGGGSAQQTPTATQARVFTPFTPNGDLVVGLAVTGEVEGSCFAASLATERPDAWRCSAGNAVLDPCFQNLLGDGATLACAEDPFAADVAMLTLGDDLPDAGAASEVDVASGLPWALELDNGAQCTLLTGATAPVAGMRINYGCSDGGQVVGEVDRSLPLWRVFYRTETRSLSLDQVGVGAAWY